MGFFQANPWGRQSPLSWSLGLYSFILLCFLLSGSRIPPFWWHCSEGCLQPSHPQQAPDCLWTWSPAEHLSFLLLSHLSQEVTHSYISLSSYTLHYAWVVYKVIKYHLYRGALILPSENIWRHFLPRNRHISFISCRLFWNIHDR